MQAILVLVYRFFKGMAFAAPFLLSAGTALLAGGASLYGLVSWVYDYVEENYTAIINFLNNVHNTLDTLVNYISSDVSGTMSQNICYMLAVDSLISDFGTFSLVVVSGIVFILGGVLVLFIAVIFRMISSSIISRVTKLFSNNSMVPS